MSASPPLVRPRERAGDRTRARLFRAAVAEFRRVGAANASVARIASAAGVSRPSFYFHFPTREHVLLELQWNLERETVERIAGGRTLREALDAFVEAMLEAAARTGSGLLRDILGLYVRRPPQLDLDHQPLPLVHELGRRFAEGAAGGELRAGLDPARATNLCLTSVFGYLSAAADSDEAQRTDLRALVSLFLEPPPRSSTEVPT